MLFFFCRVESSKTLPSPKLPRQSGEKGINKLNAAPPPPPHSFNNQGLSPLITWGWKPGEGGDRKSRIKWRELSEGMEWNRKWRELKVNGIEWKVEGEWNEKWREWKVNGMEWKVEGVEGEWNGRW